MATVFMQTREAQLVCSSVETWSGLCCSVLDDIRGGDVGEAILRYLFFLNAMSIHKGMKFIR